MKTHYANAAVLAAMMTVAACASDQPSSSEAAATSCDGASLDAGGACRTADGQFAPASCCEFGPLPADLQPIADRFAALVVDPFGQDEVTFAMDRYKFPTTDEWRRVASVSATEANLIHDASFTTHRFIVTDVGAMSNAQLDAVVEAVFPYSGPYFCGTFQELAPDWGGSDADERCEELTRELLQELATSQSHLDAYLVEVQGEQWGDLEYAKLYIASDQERTQALVFEFDIVHEI